MEPRQPQRADGRSWSRCQAYTAEHTPLPGGRADGNTRGVADRAPICREEAEGPLAPKAPRVGPSPGARPDTLMPFGHVQEVTGDEDIEWSDGLVESLSSEGESVRDMFPGNGNRQVVGISKA